MFHPISLVLPKETGMDLQHQPKVQQDKTASSSNHPPGGLFILLVLGDAICNKKNARRVARVWLRGGDLNPLTSGYEPDELPDCSTPRY